MKKAILIIALVTILASLYSCKEDTTVEYTHPHVTINVQGYSEPMVLELYYDKAPNSVRNFIHLANSGYYEGSIFHRVIHDFMIQGGSGAAGVCAIAGEFSANGFTANDVPHERGVISMARTSVPNSATSQFFIVHKTSPHLDGNYAAFGKLLSGFATLDAIASVATNYQDRPLADVVITSVSVETFGYQYQAPTCG